MVGKGRKHRKGETVKLVTANGKFYKVDQGAKKVDLKDEYGRTFRVNAFILYNYWYWTLSLDKAIMRSTFS